jgi:hypothetical protein
MPYTHKISIPDTTPVEVKNDDVAGSLLNAKFHSIQVSGAMVTVELEVGGSGVFTSVVVFADDILNANATGVTTIRLTATAAATVGLGGSD